MTAFLRTGACIYIRTAFASMFAVFFVFLFTDAIIHAPPFVDLLIRSRFSTAENTATYFSHYVYV